MYSRKRYRKQKYRYTKPTPEACGVLMKHDGHVLVVQKRGKFDVAGGKSRPNETPHETAWRKFQEETQLFRDVPNPLPATAVAHTVCLNKKRQQFYTVYVWDIDAPPTLTPHCEWIDVSTEPDNATWPLKRCLGVVQPTKAYVYKGADYSGVLA